MLQALPALLGLHCCPHSPRAVPAVSVSVGASNSPALLCAPSMLCGPANVRTAALLLWEQGVNKEEGVRLLPGLWVRAVSELSPFCFCSQDGFGWLKQGRHLLMGLSVPEGGEM